MKKFLAHNCARVECLEIEFLIANAASMATLACVIYPRID